MLFQHKDGQLRIFEHGASGTTYYLEILFTNADLSGPMGRPQEREELIVDFLDTADDARYVMQGIEHRLTPLSLTFSCRSADTTHSQLLHQLLAGEQVLAVGGISYTMHSRKGKGTSITGISYALPSFDDTYKNAYMVEVLYSGSSAYGYRWDEVYFPPEAQRVDEAGAFLSLVITGQVYGGVTRITAFTSATKLPA